MCPGNTWTETGKVKGRARSQVKRSKGTRRHGLDNRVQRKGRGEGMYEGEVGNGKRERGRTGEGNRWNLIIFRYS